MLVQVLSTMSCVELRGYAYLRADQGEQCDTPQWRFWLVISSLFAALYCVGIPLGFWYASSRQFVLASGEWWRPRVALLRASYSDRFWWFETLDLLRKFALASLVVHVEPGTKVQLWFGSVVASTSALVYLKLAPYRSTTCQQVQLVVQLQVLFTYLAASVFYQEPDAAVGPRSNVATNATKFPAASLAAQVTPADMILVLANLFCFLLLVGVMLRDWAGARARLLRGVNGRVDVPALRAGEFHLFLSHVWGTGQDQMRIVKQRLLEMIPEANIFLDVDDLREGRGAESVDLSHALLVFYSQGYTNSVNCVRELLRAFVMQKPLILLVESEMSRGGLMLDDLRVQLSAARGRCARWGLTGEVESWGYTIPTVDELHEALMAHEPIEWNRLGSLQDVTMRLIAERLLPEAPPASPYYVHGELSTQRPKMPRMHGGQHHVYCSQNNAGALELLQQAGEALGIEIVWTTNDEDIGTTSMMLLYLNGRTWTSGASSDALADDVRQAMRAGKHLVLAHEMIGLDQADERRGVEFGTFFEHADGATPRDLLRDGIYMSVAIPLKAGHYRRAGLTMLVHALGGSAPTQHVLWTLATSCVAGLGGGLAQGLRVLRRRLTRRTQASRLLQAHKSAREVMPGAIIEAPSSSDLIQVKSSKV